MYSHLDLELIRILGKSGEAPHLEDIFRVAEEGGARLVQSSFHDIMLNDENYNGIIFISGSCDDTRQIKYSPTLPPLEQSDETKQELIRLFSKN